MICDITRNLRWGTMGPHIANVERAPCDLQLIGYLIGWLDTEGQASTENMRVLPKSQPGYSNKKQKLADMTTTNDKWVMFTTFYNSVLWENNYPVILGQSC